MSSELPLVKVLYVSSLTHDMDLGLIFLTDKKKTPPWCFELLDIYVNESMQVASM